MIGIRLLAIDVRVVGMPVDNRALVVSVISAFVTLTLVVITWRYARSTEIISTETKNAANASRDAAEVSLIQSLLNVQPLLEVRIVEVEYLPSGTGAENALAGTPVRIKWKVANLGRGTAFAPTFRVQIAGVDLNPSHGAAMPVHLDPAQELQLSHEARSADRVAITEYLIASSVELSGSLHLSCYDSFGSMIESEVPLVFGEQIVRPGPAKRRYDGGSDLRTRLRALLNRMLPENETDSDIAR